MFTRLLQSRKVRLALLIMVPLALAWKLANVAAWRPRELGAPGSKVLALAFSVDGTMLAVSRERIVEGRSGGGRWAYATNEDELWRLADTKLIRKLYAPRKTSGPGGSSVALGPSQSLQFSSDGRTLMSCSVNGDIALMETASGRCLHARRAFSYGGKISSYSRFRCRTLDFSRDGRTAFYVEQWRKKGADFGKSFEEAQAVRHRANIVSCVSRNGAIIKRVPLALQAGEWPQLLALTPDGSMLMCATAIGDDNSEWGRGGKLLLFDLNTGQRRKILSNADAKGVRDMAFSRNGALAAISTGDKVRVYSIQSKQLVNIKAQDNRFLNNIAFSPDRQLLIGDMRDGSLSLWDTRTGEFLRSLGRHNKSLNALAFSPGGSTVASGGLDGNVKLWRVK